MQWLPNRTMFVWNKGVRSGVWMSIHNSLCYGIINYANVEGCRKCNWMQFWDKQPHQYASGTNISNGTLELLLHIICKAVAAKGEQIHVCLPELKYCLINNINNFRDIHIITWKKSLFHCLPLFLLHFLFRMKFAFVSSSVRCHTRMLYV